MGASIITLTTDFGEGSPYVAQMKGVILTINPRVTLIDVTHGIPPQDVAEGARILAEVSRRFPPGTIHVAVVDPGVGTSRKLVYVRWGEQQFVGPDNGLFSGLAARESPSRMITLEDPGYWLPEPSATFHGRDIMAPVAAHLSLGIEPERLGPPHGGLVILDGQETRVLPQQVEGEVVSVDSFGNLVTNISSEMLVDCPTDEQLTIRCDEHETHGLFETYGEQPASTLIALIGSGGHLELAIVGDSAHLMLGVAKGAKVSVTW